MKYQCLNKYRSILNLSHQNFCVVLEKGLVLDTAYYLCLKNGNMATGNELNFAAWLTDMSKAFQYLVHDQWLAKLNAYGFSLLASRLLQSYSSNRKQKAEINSEFSLWEEVLFGIHQGSILGPLLSNIFLWFFIMNDVDVVSYADGNTPFFCRIEIT